MVAVMLLVALLGAVEPVADNPFTSPRDEPLVRLDRPANPTSYAEISASLDRNQLPPAAAVHVEELLGHFTFDVPRASAGGHAMVARIEVAEAPWRPEHRLVWIHIVAESQETRDVKASVEFNPVMVAGYRVIGYEDQAQVPFGVRSDFNMPHGAGYSILLEIVPRGPEAKQDPAFLRQPPEIARETLNLRVRYKLPGRNESLMMDLGLTDLGGTFANASRDLRFIAAVAEFGMILRDSPFKGTSSLDSVIDKARSAITNDRDSVRTGFVTLVERARRIATGK